MLTLPWRRAEPAPSEEDELDVPTLQRVDGTWKSGVRAVRERSLEWSVEAPTAGFWLMRRPGADRLTWRVIEVWANEDGELVGGWPGIPTRPLPQFGGREWCRIREPRDLT